MYGNPKSERTPRGFSLIELLTVMAIITVFSAVSLPQIGAAMKVARMESTFQMLIGSLREARQAAVDDRQITRVSFVAPATVLIEKRDALPPNNAPATYSLIRRIDLPSQVQYAALPGLPTGAANTPDGMGSGTLAIDFNSGGTQVYFQPDGTAQDSVGNIANGVVYIARPTVVGSTRAVTLIGATGKFKGWHLEKIGASYTWRS